MSFDHRKYRPFAPISRPQRRWPDRVITQAPMRGVRSTCATAIRRWPNP
jgi:hypothetical protein